jgi:hypothetical protein
VVHRHLRVAGEEFQETEGLPRQLAKSVACKAAYQGRQAAWAHGMVQLINGRVRLSGAVGSPAWAPADDKNMTSHRTWKNALNAFET